MNGRKIMGIFSQNEYFFVDKMGKLFWHFEREKNILRKSFHL